MSALDNMRKRLQYNGGEKQQSRMIEDKLRSLKSSFKSSYQAGTIILDNPDYIEGSEEPKTLEFRCLMNPDKMTFNEDKKMLSIPFEDVCLNKPRVGKTSDGIIPVPISCGTTFIWKETDTRWLITLQYLTELAYFRADVRKCFNYPITINERTYWFASVGPNQESTEWLKHNKEEWNKLNYTRIIYIKRDSNTYDYFKRHNIINLPNINGELEPWEVQTVNSNAVENILIIHVKEYFINQFEPVSQEEQQKIQEEYEINEDYVVKVYDRFSFRTTFVQDALWEIKNKTTGINLNIDAVVSENDTIATFQLLTGKTGEFDIYYNNACIKHIVVESI